MAGAAAGLPGAGGDGGTEGEGEEEQVRAGGEAGAREKTVKLAEETVARVGRETGSTAGGRRPRGRREQAAGETTRKLETNVE